MRTVATASEIERAIDEFVQSLKQEIKVERVILFGSYITGTPDEWSDFDVAVISPDFEGVPLWRRQEILSRLSVHRHPRLSPIGFPSSEYHSPGPHSFLREVVRTGKVVYPARR